MRFRAILLGASCLIAGTAVAQNETDVLKFSQTYMKGSARFTAMGGAMGALGGDMSSFMINPAGVGVYRSSELSFSTGIFNSNQKIDFQSDRSFDGHTSLNVGNTGVVLNLFNRKDGDVRSFNIGVSYNRVNDFNQNTFLTGVNTQSSITDYFAEVAYKTPVRDFKLEHDEAFYTGAPWNAVLAWKTYLIDPAQDVDNNIIYRSPLGRLRFKGTAMEGKYDTQDDVVFQDQWEDIRGFNDVVNIAFGGNLMDVVYFGGAVNITNINYRSTKNYHEQADKNNVSNFNELFYNEFYRAYGTGASISLGAILKPIQELRIGIAYQSPTWVSMDEDYSAYMNSKFIIPNEDGFADMNTPPNRNDYRITSPQRLTGSLGFIAGNYGMLSVDVDWINYAGMSMHGSRFDRRYYNDVNSKIENTFRNTVNVRVGGELKLDDSFSFRAGYQYYQNPYKKSFINSDNATNIYSAGVGYRTRTFFLDFAYSLMKMKNGYSLYDYFDKADNIDIYSGTATANINRNSYIVTLGFKF